MSSTPNTDGLPQAGLRHRTLVRAFLAAAAYALASVAALLALAV